ncbi:MAG: hypothetical protein Q9164_007131 [Protoblastenia rupestris]
MPYKSSPERRHRNKIAQRRRRAKLRQESPEANLLPANDNLNQDGTEIINDQSGFNQDFTRWSQSECTEPILPYSQVIDACPLAEPSTLDGASLKVFASHNNQQTDQYFTGESPAPATSSNSGIQAWDSSFGKSEHTKSISHLLLTILDFDLAPLLTCNESTSPSSAAQASLETWSLSSTAAPGRSTSVLDDCDYTAADRTCLNKPLPTEEQLFNILAPSPGEYTEQGVNTKLSPACNFFINESKAQCDRKARELVEARAEAAITMMKIRAGLE